MRGALVQRAYGPGQLVTPTIATSKFGILHLLGGKPLDNCRVIAYYGSYARRYGGSARQSATATTRRKSLK